MTSKAVGVGTGRVTRKEQAEQTRQRILAVAVEKFSRAPYNDVSVTEIAREADVAHGLIFHYFTNKRRLFLDAMRSVAAELERRHLEQARGETADSPRLRIRGMFVRHLRFMSETPDLAVSILSGGIGSDPDAHAIFDEDRWRISRWWLEMVGLNAAHPALQLTTRATAGAVDAATLHWIQRPDFDVEAVADMLFDILVGALRTASRLDDTLDVSAAVAMLETDRTRTNRSPL